MKNFFSIILALIMATLGVVPAFAVQDCDCGKTPMILVSGMNTFPLVLDRGSESETQVFVPELDITSIALKTVGGLLAAAVFRDWTSSVTLSSHWQTTYWNLLRLHPTEHQNTMLQPQPFPSLWQATPI